jgi:hypothetical protein
MAPKKKPYSQLSDSAKYLRKNKKARDKKKKRDTEINKRPEQRAKRSELVKARREKGIYGKGGKDVSHTSSGLKLKSIKANRGSKSDTAGDKKARGKKK